MIVYERDSIIYCYIHIPKNSGKYIRNILIENNKNKIIDSFWGIDNIDLAHIPFMLKENYIDFLKLNKNINDIQYFTYTRNPYYRIISAYIYKNPNNSSEDFKNFVSNELINFNFYENFNWLIIHYYPQYLFICDTNLQIPTNIKIEKFEKTKIINDTEIIVNKKIYDLFEYYDNNTLKIINKIYELDFKLFNYELIPELITEHSPEVLVELR